MYNGSINNNHKKLYVWVQIKKLSMKNKIV